MAEESFSTLGKIAALDLLFDGSGFDRAEDPAFTPEKGATVRTCARTFLEGTDFDLVYFPLKHLGYKCAAATAAGLLAALAHPRSLSVRLGVSAKLDFPQVRELWSGVVAAAKEFGFASLGLDLVPSQNGLVISVNAIGEESALTCGRVMKPRSKDLLCVSGSLGAAFLGFQVLEREKRQFEKTGKHNGEALEKYRMLVGSYLKPEVPAGALSALEEAQVYPSAGVLVSHGLSDAVRRIVRATGLGAKVYADKIPFEGNSFSLGKELDIDPVSAAMNGGDDFRLLYIIPILQAEKFRRDFQSFDIIGHLAQGDVGAVLVTPEGVELPLRAQGWEDPE